MPTSGIADLPMVGQFSQNLLIASFYFDFDSKFSGAKVLILNNIKFTFHNIKFFVALKIAAVLQTIKYLLLLGKISCPLTISKQRDERFAHPFFKCLR